MPKREHLPAIKAKEARGTRKLVAVMLITEFKVFLSQQSRKKTLIAKKSSKKKLIQREKSKELITSMGNTEYFELCEISSNIPCFVCSLNWEVGIVYYTCGKSMQPSERNRQLNKARYDVLSIPSYVVKKESYPWRQTSMRQCMFYKAHEMLKKARKHKNGCKNILDRWNMTNTANLCQILGGLRKVPFYTMNSHWKTILAMKEEVMETVIECKRVYKDH